MKFSFYLAALCLLIFSSCGLLLRDKSMSYQFDKLPSDPLPADASTYQLHFIDKVGVNDLGLTKSKVNEDYVDFEKYRYVNDKGDLMLLFHFLDPLIDVDTLSYKGKTENEGIAAELDMYKYKFDIETKIDYAFLDGHRKLITKGSESYRSSKEFDGAKGKTELSRKWAEEKNAKMDEWLKESLERNLSNIKVKLIDLYDMRPTSFYVNTYSVRNAEKKRLTDMDRAFDIFESALSYTKLENEHDKMYELLDEARAIWEKIINRQRLNNNDQRKIYYACAKNIANAYLVEEKYDSTLHFLDLATKADHKSGELRRFREDVIERMNTIEKNKNINYSYAGKYNEAEAKKSEYLKDLMASTYQGNKLTTMFGDTYEGNVEYEFDQGDYLNITRVRITEKGTNRVRNFRPNDIRFIFEGEKKYRLFEVSPVKMLKVWMASEVVLETNYAGLYKNSDGNDFILTKKIGESEEAVPTFHIDFLDINKGIKQFYTNCTTVSQNANDRAYSKTEYSLSKLILSYTECKM